MEDALLQPNNQRSASPEQLQRCMFHRGNCSSFDFLSAFGVQGPSSDCVFFLLRAIGTRYVGKKSRNHKVDAALYNFKALAKAGGPQQFFRDGSRTKGNRGKSQIPLRASEILQEQSLPEHFDRAAAGPRLPGTGSKN